MTATAQNRLGWRLLIGLASAVAPAPAVAAAVPVSLVGWWLNPTPNNAWLRTGDTEYVVSEQGGVSADGDWPEFGAGRFVKTSGSYGYGCATLRALVDGKRVATIDSAASLPLKRCRASPALRKSEPSIK